MVRNSESAFLNSRLGISRKWEGWMGLYDGSDFA
jgi:hypothetical protein